MTLFEIDKSILLFIQGLRFTLMDGIMSGMSAIGNAGIIWLALCAGLLVFKKTRRTGFDILLSLAIVWSISDLIIKPLIARPRPFVSIAELEVLIKLPAGFSFPSGHACSSFASAYVCSKSFGGYGKWFWVLAFLISISRVYVGVHYLSDVVAGALVGAFGSMWVYSQNKRMIPQTFLKKE